jgi:diguanylate cyclase
LIVWFGFPHSPGLVLLSILIAACGGYVGLGLATQAADAFGLRRRGLLAGAAWSLGLSIWTMHFVGMLAAQLPEGTLYSVLLTLLSFMLCVLVVGIAAFIVTNYRGNLRAIAAASAIMGLGIVVMHYLGMHAVNGKYMMHHDSRFSVLASAIAVGASYGALRLFEYETTKKSLALSAAIFGLAVSGMHYTAMLGTELMPLPEPTNVFGPSVSSDVLMIVVAVLAFIVSAVFLLYLIPEKSVVEVIKPTQGEPSRSQVSDPPPKVTHVPVESDSKTRMFAVVDIHAVQATTHYCLIYDGLREHFCSWSISEVEQKLDKDRFIRIHRSHVVAIDKIKQLRKSGDSAVVEIGLGPMRSIPVSRNHYAELKSRLGLQSRLRMREEQVSTAVSLDAT